MATVKQVTAAALFTFVLYPAVRLAQANTAIAAVAQAATDPKPTAPVILTLSDVSGFSGGQDLAIDADGNLFVRTAGHNPDQPATRFWEQRYHVTLSPAELSTLIAFVRTSGIARYQERRRNGVPDEARPVIRVVFDGQNPLEAAKWADDNDVNFDALYNRLLALTKRAAETPAYRRQPYDRAGTFP